MLYCVKHDVCFGIDSDIDHHVIEMSTDQFNPSRMYLFFSLSLSRRIAFLLCKQKCGQSNLLGIAVRMYVCMIDDK